ncbi:MAG: glutamate 5-kinase [Deltaproteobacteria bacterium]|nr:glutamate 5-kinase [Deltaproteobacteria bacterium]
MNRERLVLKVGTNVLQRPSGRLDYNLISELAEQIASLRVLGHEVLLVSSGSVGAGRELLHLGQTTTDQLRQHQLLAAVGQARLMQIYTDFFREHQITVAQVLLTRGDFSTRASYLNIRDTLENLLKAGVLPIVNENDVVATDELLINQFGDNDQLAVYVAALADADRLLFLTVAPGLLREKTGAGSPQPEVVEQVEKLSEELLRLCLPATSRDGKGGMESKVRCAGMAMDFGIHAHILDGKRPEGVLDILEGRGGGTHFVSKGRKVNSYQKWLAAGAFRQGRLHIDAGAEQALLEHKKSLLAKGITKVEGEFDLKDLVEILGPSGIRLGVGRSSFSSRELQEQLFAESSGPVEASARSGGLSKPVVHRNHLFLERSAASS